MSTENMFALVKELEDLREEHQGLYNEIAFLKERNKELRQKAWINVYDENLILIDENKALRHENDVKYHDLVKYEKTIEQLRNELMQVGQIADKYYQDAINLNNENKRLTEVIKSVETFVNQFTK